MGNRTGGSTVHKGLLLFAQLFGLDILIVKLLVGN